MKVLGSTFRVGINSTGMALQLRSMALHVIKDFGREGFDLGFKGLNVSGGCGIRKHDNVNRTTFEPRTLNL